MGRAQAFILRGSPALAAAAFSAILVLALGHGGPTPGRAQAEPEMAFRIGSCTEDCEVIIGSQFALSIDGTVLPAGGYSAFATEVRLDGMTYAPRACEAEVLIEPLELCLGPTLPWSGEIIHGGVTGLGLPLVASTSTQLLELAVTCTERGEHELTLTAFPSSAVGAQFANLNAEEIPVRTVGTRDVPAGDPVDPQAVIIAEREVAAVMSVSCVTAPSAAPATPTATGPSDLPPTGDGGAGSAGGLGATVMLSAIVAALAIAIAAFALVRWRGRRTT